MERSRVVLRRADLHGRDVNAAVKLMFAHGAALDDPAGLFNASLGGGTRRAIDVPRATCRRRAAALVRAAVARNAAR